MAVHPKLAEFKNAKFIKVFNKYLGGIESDLERIGVRDFQAEVLTVGSQSVPGRVGTALLGLGYSKPQEALNIVTQVYECPVEILVPVGVGKISLPYIMSVILPGNFSWHVVYKKTITGFKWQSEPKNKDLTNQLKKATPKAIKKQKQHQKALEYILKQCYEFQSAGQGNVEWLIYSGYQGGMLSGGYRPRVTDYLEAIPQVKAALSN